MLVGTFEKLPLGAAAHEVVLGILCLVVEVAVDVIGQEANRLHVGEQLCGIGQVLNLDRGEEGGSALEVTLCEALEDFHVEAYVLEVGVVLFSCVGSRAEIVAEVGENEVRHDGVEVDDAEHVAVFLKEDVVHLRVAVADALGQFSLAIEAFALRHFLCACFDGVHEVLHFCQASALVGFDGFAQLPEAELHVVEVLDGLAKLDGDVGQPALELSEGLAHDVACLRRHFRHRHGVGDEDHHAPVLFAVKVVVFAILGGDEAQAFALNVLFSIKFFADVVGDGYDVAHQHVYVGEDGVVDVLKHIVGSIGLGSGHFVGCVDEAVSERLHFFDSPLDVKLRNNLLQVLLVHGIIGFWVLMLI